MEEKMELLLRLDVKFVPNRVAGEVKSGVWILGRSRRVVRGLGFRDMGLEFFSKAWFRGRRFS